MADNVTLPGTGSEVATDEIAGKHYQRIKMGIGADGVYEGDINDDLPMPVKAVDELMEVLEALRMSISAFTRNMPLPSVAGLMRVDGSGVTQPVSGTVTTNPASGTITTVTTVTTVTNQTNVGGQPAQYALNTQMLLGADNLRNRISVT